MCLTPPHPDDTTLLRTIRADDGITPDTLVAVEEHLADCGDCRERLRRILHLRERFAETWAAWNAVEHGEAADRARLGLAVAAAARSSPELHRRVADWWRGVSSAGIPSLRVFADRVRRLAAASPLALPIGWKFSLESRFQGVGSPQGDMDQLLLEASTHLANAREEAAGAALDLAAQRDARSAQASLSKVATAQGSVAEISVDSRRGTLTVRLWPAARSEQPGFALLVPDSPTAPPLLAEYEPVEGENYLIAEFFDLSDGAASLVLGISAQRAA